MNYEDPNYNVSIPVFMIHGNHDDPAGVSLNHTNRERERGEREGERGVGKRGREGRREERKRERGEGGGERKSVDCRY